MNKCKYLLEDLILFKMSTLLTVNYRFNVMSMLCEFSKVATTKLENKIKGKKFTILQKCHKDKKKSNQK